MNMAAVTMPRMEAAAITLSVFMDWQAFWLTMRLAFSVTALLLIIGFPLAYWIAFSKWRWKFLVEAIVGLPIVLPPTVLGFYVLIALGQRSLFGRWWQSMTGHTLAFTFAGLVIGSVLYSLPFAVQPLAASFSNIDSRLLAASAVLGVSKLQTFWRVIVPLSTSGLVTAMALTKFASVPISIFIADRSRARGTDTRRWTRAEWHRRMADRLSLRSAAVLAVQSPLPSS